MEHVKLKDYKGVEIEVSDYSGHFHASYLGDRLSAETLPALEAQIDRKLRQAKVKVSIPITQLGIKYYKGRYGGRGHWGNGPGVRHLTLTGVHSRTHRVLAKEDETGDTVQLNDNGDYTRRLTDEEVVEYIRLSEAEQAAKSALRNFEKSVALPLNYRGLDAFVKQAMAEKIDTPDEAGAEAAELMEDPR